MIVYLIVLALHIWVTLSNNPQFIVKNNKIYDRQGGMRIFHGLNLVEKVPPYYETSFTETDMKKLKEWGINGLRLGVMWPGVEPKQGEFNQTYLNYMVNLVETAGSKYGIYTLVEFHQDLFSEKFCADGVPMWAIPRSTYSSFPRPLKLNKAHFDNQTGLPLDTCGKLPWAEFYFTDAVNKAFGDLWKNKNGLLNKFANYWKKVALAFKDSKYVIGYQLINEPWPGNLYQNPLIMVPGISEKIHLQHAYDFLSQQIRGVDPNHNICFEPVTWLNNFQSGFTHPPGGHRFKNQSLFCYHYYSPPTLSLQKFMNARLKDIKKLDVGGILSQFYTINAQGQKNIAMMDLCDKHSHSWFGWLYNLGKGQYIIKQIRRTYAQRTAGEIITQFYSEQTKDFLLSFYADPEAGQTIIFIDIADNYASGYFVECSPHRCQYSLKQNLYIYISSDQFKKDEMVSISITKL